MKAYLRLLLAGGVLMAVFAATTPAFAGYCGSISDTYGFTSLCAEVDTAMPDAVDTIDTETDQSADPFTGHEPPEDTLFGRRWYGRLADNANVYAEPSRAAPIVRNVGDGYLFATVNSWFDNDAGETWYEINYGEYVHADDISMGDPSDFRGVTISSQPQRPFGWVVADVFPSSAPDGEPDESVDKLLRYTFVEIYDVVQGEEDWLWYDIGDGRWVKQTFFSIVDVNPRPAEVGELVTNTATAASTCPSSTPSGRLTGRPQRPTICGCGCRPLIP